MTKTTKYNLFSTFLIQHIVCSETCPSSNPDPIESCKLYPTKTTHQQPNIPFIAKDINFNSGFHGVFNISCANFKKPTWIQQLFPRNVFVDVDEINRLTTDQTSSLNGKRDQIIIEKYPIDIEAPVWLENNFWIKLKCGEKLNNFEFPIHIRYHRADYGMPHEMQDKTFETTKFETTVCDEGFTVLDLSKNSDKSYLVPVADKKQLEMIIGLTFGTIFACSILILKS